MAKSDKDEVIVKALSLIAPTTVLIKDLTDLIADIKYDISRTKAPRKLRQQIRTLQFYNSVRHHLEHLEVLKGGSNG